MTARSNVLNLVLLFGAVCLLILGGSHLRQRERDLPRSVGYDCWGSQEPVPVPVPVKKFKECCQTDAGCVDTPMLCTQYLFPCDELAYARFAVANRDRCVGTGNGAEWCESIRDEEHWVKCARYEACKWDASLHDCVLDGDEDPLVIKVPPTCNDSIICP